MHRIGRFVPLAILALVFALVAAPATSVPKPAKVNPALLKHMSQAFEGRQQAAQRLARLGDVRRQGAPFGDRFNRDSVGLPQNEESVTVCRNRPNIVVGGTNDYRGLLDPQGNFTGWQLSTNGGRSVAKEGLLPPVRANGQVLPSGGDPVR